MAGGLAGVRALPAGLGVLLVIRACVWGDHSLEDILLLSLLIHFAYVGLPSLVHGGDICPDVCNHVDVT